MTEQTAANLYRLCPTHGTVRASVDGLCPQCSFTCPICGGTYERDPGWTPEQMEAEYQANFVTEIRNGPRVRVCDDCYGEFMAWAKKKGLAAQ